ncbi:hypothetical protein [Bradyrhizobium sp. CCBAU 051011]|nr:hypothetical protein [Bradyrhizobium sp. CCBAU 051011]
MRCSYCHNPDTWHLKDGTYVQRNRSSLGSAALRRHYAHLTAA